MAYWSMFSLSPTPMAMAPPELPSPITVQMMGVFRRDITARFCAMDSEIPRSSESIPG